MLPKEVLIREVGPREGFQTIKTPVATDDKLTLIDALSRAKLRSIEITSFVRPDRIPQMADADDVAARFKRMDGVLYHALYLNEAGFARALAVKRLDLEAWLPFAVSDRFLKENSNSTFAELLARAPAWVTAFRNAGLGGVRLMVSTAFGYHGEPFDQAILSSRIESAIEAIEGEGAVCAEVCLADTVGLANPEQVRRVVGEIRSISRGADVTLHLHDTRGSGIANVYAGLLEGVTVFDASVGGLGGCPFAEGAAGNVATEDVVYLCESCGVSTGVDLPRLVEAAVIAEKVTGRPLGGKYTKSQIPKVRV